MSDDHLSSAGDVTWAQIRDGAEGSWPLEGPSSHGGTTLYRFRGRLFVVGYGESSSLPGGAEQILGSRPDDSGGFPPAMAGGHTAGCRHDRWRNADWWQNGRWLLERQEGTLRLLEAAEVVWTCSVERFAPGSPERDDVLRHLGPAVLDEALRCAARAQS